MAIQLVVLKLPHVFESVRTNQGPLTVEHPVFKLTDVFPPSEAVQYPLPVHFSIFELPNILITVWIDIGPWPSTQFPAMQPPKDSRGKKHRNNIETVNKILIFFLLFLNFLHRHNDNVHPSVHASTDDMGLRFTITDSGDFLP